MKRYSLTALVLLILTCASTAQAEMMRYSGYFSATVREFSYAGVVRHPAEDIYATWSLTADLDLLSYGDRITLDSFSSTFSGTSFTAQDVVASVAPYSGQKVLLLDGKLGSTAFPSNPLALSDKYDDFEVGYLPWGKVNISRFYIDTDGAVRSFETDTRLGRWSAAPTPIPGAVWLLGSGLVGLVGLRRKARS